MQSSGTESQQQEQSNHRTQQQLTPQQQWMAMQYPPPTAMVMPHQHPQMLTAQNYTVAHTTLPHYVAYAQYPVPPHHRVQRQHQLGSSGGADEENRSIWVGDLDHWMDEAYLNNCFGSTNEVISGIPFNAFLHSMFLAVATNQKLLYTRIRADIKRSN